MKFTIPGNPVGKARARVVNGRAYTPKKTREYERFVALMAWQAMSRIPKREWKDLRDATLYGTRPVVMECGIYFPDKRRRDSDNVIKSIQDGCEGVLWDDDHNVMGRPMKVERGSDNPRVEVEVREV